MNKFAFDDVFVLDVVVKILSRVCFLILVDLNLKKTNNPLTPKKFRRENFSHLAFRNVMRGLRLTS